MKSVAKLILYICGLSLGASATPVLTQLTITGGSIGTTSFGTGWDFEGDGFFARGSQDTPPTNCGVCAAPFQLLNPVFSGTVQAANGFLALGSTSFDFPSLFFNFTSPSAEGFAFITPAVALPTVTGAGTIDVPFNIGADFCLSLVLHVPGPQPGDPGCLSEVLMTGNAIAHFEIIQALGGGPDLLFQPLPTWDIVPEPKYLGAVAGVLLAMILTRKWKRWNRSQSL